MEQTNDRPKWLMELENRKKKPHLAHEAGAGAPCMICNASCPGLDLHFWRKICKICKCSRDDHDVCNNDFPQFDLLFGPSGKLKKKPILLHIPIKKQNDSETIFDWVPPDTTKEVATDYMNALPIEKLPISGSSGAILRKQLLQKQLPLHDIDHKACDELSEGEKRELEKYVENLKKYAGQGKVMKMLGAQPFDRSLMTPINATDMQCFNTQHEAQKPITIPQLRTPSSFAKHISYGKIPYENKPDLQLNVGTIDNEENNLDKEDSKHVAFHTIVNSSIPTYEANLEILPIACRYGCHEPIHCKHIETKSCSLPTIKDAKKLKYVEPNTTPLKDSIDLQAVPSNAEMSNSTMQQEMKLFEAADTMLANALLPPSAIHSHDIISSTLDKEELTLIRDKLNSKYSMQETSQGNYTQNFSHTKGTDKAIIMDSQRSYSSIVPIKSNVIDMKKKDPQYVKPITAEKYVSKTASEVIQSTSVNNIAPTFVYDKSSIHPKHRLSDTILHSLQKDNVGSNINMSENKPISSLNSQDKYDIDIDHKEVSNQCELPSLHCNVSNVSNVSNASNANCIKGILSGIKNVPTTVSYSENLHCQVFPSEVNYEGDQFTQNPSNINAVNETMKDLTIGSSKPQNCDKCQKQININDIVVTVEKAKNILWHPGCFVCSVCNELLVDLVYFYYKNQLYCGRDLASLLGIPRCFACDELIFVREYTVAEGHNYHIKHFCCWNCDIPLAGQQYISENDHPLCLPCYQITYAKTCNACNAVIAADQQGVAIKNLNFHATEKCFCCFTCKTNLLNSRMAIKDDKLFCSKDCIFKFSTRINSG